MKPLLSSVVTVTFCLLLAPGCATTPSDGGPSCTGSKCDDPGTTADKECQDACKASKDPDCVKSCRDDKALEHCQARRSDALSSSHKAYVGDAIRWSCSDVEGVNTNGNDDRGQEYCEYYAVVQPPPAKAGDTTVPPAVDLGHAGSALSLTLTDDQVDELDDAADAVVGECIFTSWHQDVEGPLPSCNGDAATCPAISVPSGAHLPSWMTAPELGSFKLTADMARMTVNFNSNGAAADLLEKCLVDPPTGDPAKADDPLNDTYTRGCWKAYCLFGTEWRRSDPTICTAAMRAAECGCGVDTDGDGTADLTGVNDIARALVPRQPQGDQITLRGFKLGTWSDAHGLPAGCRYLDTGDDSQTLVACDLTATDVLSSQTDVKGRCREKYGDNVVVHIPIPASAIVCSPPKDGAYSSTCGETVPWVAPDAAQTPGT